MRECRACGSEIHYTPASDVDICWRCGADLAEETLPEPYVEPWWLRFLRWLVR